MLVAGPEPGAGAPPRPPWRSRTARSRSASCCTCSHGAAGAAATPPSRCEQPSASPDGSRAAAAAGAAFSLPPTCALCVRFCAMLAAVLGPIPIVTESAFAGTVGAGAEGSPGALPAAAARDSASRVRQGACGVRCALPGTPPPRPPCSAQPRCRATPAVDTVEAWSRPAWAPHAATAAEAAPSAAQSTKPLAATPCGWPPAGVAGPWSGVARRCPAFAAAAGAKRDRRGAARGSPAVGGAFPRTASRARRCRPPASLPH